MKYLVTLALLSVMVSNAPAQDKYAAFNGNKKSIDLKTGIRMKYIDTGNPKGEPVILLHGYTDASRSFQLMIDELGPLNKNLRIIAPDMRGHGQSSMPAAVQCREQPMRCFTMDLFASDVIDLMDQLKIQQATVVGASMGSVVAQTLALQYPGRLKKMVLVGTLVNGKKSAAIHDFILGEMIGKNWRSILEKRPGFTWPADAYLLTPADLGNETAEFLRANWIAEVCTDDKFIDAVYPETMKTPLGTWIGPITALSEWDNNEALKKLKTPTLILWGTQDPLLTQDVQEEVKSAFRSAAVANGTQVIFKIYGKNPFVQDAALNEIGHNIQWAAPKEVAMDVNAFIVSGKPIASLPYANPKNVKEILTDNTSKNIEVLK